MSKYYTEEYDGNWEIWSTDEDPDNDALIATVYDESFADQIVALLNRDAAEDEVYEEEPEEFGEEVDEYIAKDSGLREKWEDEV